MSTLRAVPLFLLWLALPALANDHSQPAVQPATSFAAVEVHEDEKVAIAAEPYDTKEKESIFHVDYLSHGVLPIRLIVTNLGDKPISLRDARILFETAAGDRIQAAEPEDVERMMDPREKPKTIPLPGPLPSIRLKPKNKNVEVEQDFDTFEYGALVVEPHTTRAGFLFYVVPISNPLRGGDMYINRLRNSEGEQLFPFQISFNKYLNATAGGTK